MTMIKRDPSFELKKHLSSNWANDDAFLTAVLNALSFCFPKGEKFFMNSVRAFKDDIRLKDVLNDQDSNGNPAVEGIELSFVANEFDNDDRRRKRQCHGDVKSGGGLKTK